MATGLYWCLVLTECLSLAVISTASFTQTTPPDSTPVCPGGRLVFTCVTDVNMGVYWRGDNGGTRPLINTSVATTVDSFTVRVAKQSNKTTLVTTATNESVPIQLNGSNISCSGNEEYTYETLYIRIAGIKSLS